MFRSACAIFLLATATLASPAASAAPCMVRGWDPTLLTPNEQVIPPEGGLLVGIQSGESNSGPGPAGKTNPALTELVLVRKGKRVKLVAEPLAPGLARYRPDKAVAGKWTIEGIEGKRVTEFAATDLAPLPAPQLAAVARHITKMPRRGATLITDHLNATLAVARPDAAIGLVLYAGPGDDGAALLAQTAAGDALTVHLYSTPGRCQAEVAGRRLPAVGDEVRLAWFDAVGRLSPRSPPIAVTERAGAGGPADITTTPPTTTSQEKPPADKPASKSKNDDGCQVGGESSSALMLLALLLVWRRRRQQPTS